MPSPSPTDPGSTLSQLLEQGRDQGFLGPGPVAAHIEHARAFAEVAGVGFSGRGIDLGSGAGVPGLMLALWLPQAHWVLVDARLRRVRFLEMAVAELSVGDHTAVLHARAEDLGRQDRWRASADLVVARSFGPPAVVAECAAPLLRLGGLLTVSEPPRAEGGRWPAAGLDPLGLQLRAQGIRAGVHLAELIQRQACPDAYPRRAGVPARSPLF